MDAIDDGLIVIHHVEHEDVRSGRSLLQDVAGTAKRSHHTDARLTREEVPGFLSDEPTRVHNANGRGFGQRFAPTPSLRLSERRPWLSRFPAQDIYLESRCRAR